MPEVEAVDDAQEAMPSVEGDAAAIAAALHAHADPNRLRILNLLAGGSMCVCDLVELLEIPQPRTSRHLATLRETGLVEVTRRGRHARYRIGRPEDPFAAAVLAWIRRSLVKVPSLRRERTVGEERAAQRREHPCC